MMSGKQIIELIPGILFFIVYMWSKDLILSTSVLLVSLLAQILILKLFFNKLDKLALGLFLLSLPLFLLTIGLKDERFIKYKPTLVQGLFALVFWLSYWIFSKNLTEKLLTIILGVARDAPLTLTPKDWGFLNSCVVFYFLFVALLNAGIAYFLPSDIWVTFKVFGILALNLVGLILLFVFLAKKGQLGEK
jgi:intracellular septation protein